MRQEPSAPPIPGQHEARQQPTTSAAKLDVDHVVPCDQCCVMMSLCKSLLQQCTDAMLFQSLTTCFTARSTPTYPDPTRTGARGTQLRSGCGAHVRGPESAVVCTCGLERWRVSCESEWFVGGHDRYKRFARAQLSRAHAPGGKGVANVIRYEHHSQTVEYHHVVTWCEPC